MAMFYTDYELSAPDKATMLAALSQLGINGESGFANGGRYTLSIYGEKWMPTGSTTVNSIGAAVPVMAAAPGYYALLRWLGASVTSAKFPPRWGDPSDWTDFSRTSC
jgi:hypothetical protein